MEDRNNSNIKWETFCAGIMYATSDDKGDSNNYISKSEVDDWYYKFLYLSKCLVGANIKQKTIKIGEFNRPDGLPNLLYTISREEGIEVVGKNMARVAIFKFSSQRAKVTAGQIRRMLDDYNGLLKEIMALINTSEEWYEYKEILYSKNFGCRKKIVSENILERVLSNWYTEMTILASRISSSDCISRRITPLGNQSLARAERIGYLVDHKQGIKVYDADNCIAQFGADNSVWGRLHMCQILKSMDDLPKVRDCIEQQIENSNKVGIRADFESLFHNTGKDLNEVVSILEDKGYSKDRIAKTALKMLGGLTWKD